MDLLSLKIRNVVHDKVNNRNVIINKLEYGSFSDEIQVFVEGSPEPIDTKRREWDFEINARPWFEFEGIKLTEKILFNNGFKRRFGNEIFIWNGSALKPGIEIHLRDDTFVFWVEDEIGENSVDFVLEYVHDLENLYYFMRKEILKINL